VKKSAPSGKDLETALLTLLRKNNFSGAAHISVFVVGPKPTSVYIVTLGVDVATVLKELLASVIGRRTHPSPTEWVLFRTEAESIIESAANAP
jgi:hypothetical protein